MIYILFRTYDIMLQITLPLWFSHWKQWRETHIIPHLIILNDQRISALSSSFSLMYHFSQPLLVTQKAVIISFNAINPLPKFGI